MITQTQITTQRVLADYLRTVDARCPICAYSLRNCPSDRCPECGAALTLRLAAHSSGVGWWLAAVLGSSVSFTMSLVMLYPVMLVISGVSNNPFMESMVNAGMAPIASLPNWRQIWVISAVTSATCILLGWALGQRQAFVRRSSTVNAIIGLLAACSPVVVLLIFNRSLAWL